MAVAYTGLGMSVSGVVQSPAGVRCGDCRVLAVHLTLHKLITAHTGRDGEYRLINMPAGSYTIAVIDSRGNMNPITAVFDGGPGPRVTASDVSLDVEDGVNVKGLVLPAPVPSLVISEEELLAEIGGAWGPPDGRAPAARPALGCEAPPPMPVYHPPAPDPSTRLVFAARRGADVAVAPPESPCRNDSALACTQPELRQIDRNIPADRLPVCRADGLLILPTDLIETPIQFRPPQSPRYSPEPPDAASCAEIRKADCGGPSGYHSFSGMQVHECTHRTLVEQTAKRLFDEYFAAVRRIQSQIDAEGRCFECCKRREPAAVDAYVLFRRRTAEEINKLEEEPAYEAECQYYKSRHGEACGL
jgi:hypothetical protein